MRETDNLWTQLFQDEPIKEISLRNLQTGVMSQILANPIDFQAKILMAQRRKWGLALLIVLFIAGLGLFGLVWFGGDWLFNVMRLALEGFQQKWILFSRIKLGLEFLWQQYVWSVMGFASVWVLFDGIRHKMLVKD